MRTTELLGGGLGARIMFSCAGLGCTVVILGSEKWKKKKKEPGGGGGKRSPPPAARQWRQASDVPLAATVVGAVEKATGVCLNNASLWEAVLHF